jgi:predicted nucleic acid-binding protein
MNEGRAEAEAAWFYGTHGGQVPVTGPDREAALATERRLASLVTFHRGAFALWFSAKEWPARIHREFRVGASLVVRLECALHPAVGRSTDELEAAAVARLVERIVRGSAEDERHLARLRRRAERHFRLAVKALAGVGGVGVNA